MIAKNWVVTEFFLLEGA